MGNRSVSFRRPLLCSPSWFFTLDHHRIPMLVPLEGFEPPSPGLEDPARIRTAGAYLLESYLGDIVIRVNPQGAVDFNYPIT
jgi:hypothetical protein